MEEILEKSHNFVVAVSDGTAAQKILSRDPSIFTKAYLEKDIPKPAYEVYKQYTDDIDNIDKYPKTM